jgi:hypothetical protein
MSRVMAMRKKESVANNDMETDQKCTVSVRFSDVCGKSYILKYEVVRSILKYYVVY